MTDMTSIEALIAYAAELAVAAARATAAADIQHQLVNGGEADDVLTESGAVPSLAKQAVQAQAKVAEALLDVAAQMAGAMTYDSTAKALLSVPNEGYFSVPSGSDKEYSILYKNNAGVAQEIKRYPNDVAVKDVLAMVQPGSASAPYFAATDETGFVRFLADNQGGFGTSEAYFDLVKAGNGAWSIDGSGNELCLLDNEGFVIQDLRPNGTYQAAAYKLPGGVIQHAAAGLHFTDEFGFVALGLGNDGIFSSSLSANSVSSIGPQQAARNGVNLAFSAAVRGEFNTEVQRPVCKYNHILMWGQSLSTGYEGWPTLSKNSYGGNLMFGNSPRPASSNGAAFSPLGGAVLKPLRPVVQSMDGSTVLTDEQVSTLSPGAGNEGESPEVAAVNFARKMFLQYHGMAADPQRLFVASNCGVAGRTIEQLSKGATPNIYLRLLQAAQGVKAIADAEGASYCIPAIFFMQGEWNYIDTYGGDTTKEGYKSKLLAQANLWNADLAQGVAAQDSKPAIITYQTGGNYTRDTNDLSVGMAQWELSQEQNNWYLATPAYPYTDKGGHLDPNGYRWLGAQMGKVFHRVVTLGQGWRPLSPRRVTVQGREILIDFHVPCPPLVFAKPYVVLNAVDYADKGFRVIDSLGTVPLLSVQIVSETQVLIALSRNLDSSPKVQYAAATGSSGNGNLRDSDKTVSSDLYLYQEGAGQYTGANIGDLVNKPYPLHNWCIAFSLTPEVIK